MSGGIAIDENGMQITISDSNTTATLPAANPCAAVRQERLFKSLNGCCAKLATTCSPDDVVSVYNINGRLLAKGSVKLLAGCREFRLSRGIFIYKLEPKTK